MRRSLVHPTESNSPILPVLGLGSQVRACWPGGRGKALNDQHKGGGQQLQIIPFLPNAHPAHLGDLQCNGPAITLAATILGESESAGQQEMADFLVLHTFKKNRSSLDNRRSLLMFVCDTLTVILHLV